MGSGWKTRVTLFQVYSEVMIRGQPSISFRKITSILQVKFVILESKGVVMVKTEVVVVVEVKRFYAVHNTYTRVFTHIHIHIQ